MVGLPFDKGVKELQEKEMKVFLNGLADSMQKDTIIDNPEVFAGLEREYQERPGKFISSVQYAFADYLTLAENAMNLPSSEEAPILEHILTGLYRHFHETRIERLEGFRCCADKSGFVEGMTVRALKSKQNLSLFDDYQKTEQIKEHKEKQAFWSPKSIQDTDEAIRLFWDWYLLNPVAAEKK